MKSILLSLVLAAAAVAADSPKPLTELQATRMKLLFAEEKLAQLNVEKIQNDQRTAYTDICKSAGIAAADFSSLVKACVVDFEKNTVAAREQPPAPSAPAK